MLEQFLAITATQVLDSQRCQYQEIINWAAASIPVLLFEVGGLPCSEAHPLKVWGGHGKDLTDRLQASLNQPLTSYRAKQIDGTDRWVDVGLAHKGDAVLHRIPFVS